MTDHRTEAAARAIFDEEGPESIDDDGAEALAMLALAAADAHDRANSIARIRLDDELAEKIAQAIHDDECSGIHDANDCWYERTEWERNIYRRNARAVLELLRGEAL